MLALILRLVGARQSRHVVTLLGLVAACVLGGGALFAWTQHIAFTTGLYWAITTATTVGYGDVIPHDPAGAQHALVTGPTDGDVLVSAVLLRKEAPAVAVSALVRSASVG
jgi:hypothetical protein